MSLYLVDTEKLAEEMRLVPSAVRGEYLRNSMRDLWEGRCTVAWAEPYEPISESHYSKHFEEFWKLYPRKTGKGAAYKAWKATKFKELHLLEACKKALAWQKEEENWVKDKGQFIPHASTYLNQRRWEDEKDKPEEATGATYTDMNGIVRRKA